MSDKIKENEYEVPIYTDANHDVDRFFNKAASKIIVVGAALITVTGFIISLNASISMSQGDVKSAAVILPAKMHSTAAKPTLTPTVEPTQNPEPVKKRSVLLDAGHGGFDPGTHGKWTGIAESEINLAITKKLEKLLLDNGYAVMLTRTDSQALAPGKEGDMQAREEMIVNSGADIFVCIHQNAFDREDVCGPEVYYNTVTPDSIVLASVIEEQLSQVPNIATSRGVKTYGHRLTKHMQYSVLIECGFLTNRDEEAKLVDDSYQQIIAQAIFNGIESFYANHYDKN